MPDTTPIRADGLPMLFLSVVRRLVATFGGDRCYADRVRLAHHLLERSGRAALPADMLNGAAVELATLTTRVASVGEYFAHVEEIERGVRHIVAGIDMAQAARVEGEPLFTRYYNHRAMFAERRDAG